MVFRQQNAYKNIQLVQLLNTIFWKTLKSQPDNSLIRLISVSLGDGCVSCKHFDQEKDLDVYRKCIWLVYGNITCFHCIKGSRNQRQRNTSHEAISCSQFKKVKWRNLIVLRDEVSGLRPSESTGKSISRSGHQIY